MFMVILMFLCNLLHFKVALPTAIHLSYSGNLLKNRYVTFGLTQRVPLTKNSFKSPNLFYVNLAKQIDI